MAKDSTTQVFDTLRTLIAPGNRVRLSPYVESAQFSVLFGERPAPDKRYGDSIRILNKNAGRIEALSRRWADFVRSGKHFEGGAYDTEFLEAYLAYYFTTNVCKVQLLLLDLVARGKLTGHLSVADFGVGSGTTAVATLDFLAAWSTVCRLYGQPFPIESLELHGFDCNPETLRQAGQMALSFAEALEERAGPDSASGTTALLCEAARTSRWIPHELGATAPHLDRKPWLLVASNVLNELSPAGQQNLADTIRSLSSESLAIIIEPGDAKNTRRLNAWRRDLVRAAGDIVPLLPCGGDLGRNQSEACGQCWNARREHLHPSPLYRRFRESASGHVGDRRSWDDFENNLLSWSYSVLQPSSHHNAPAEPSWRNVSGAIQGTVRYIGNYRRRGPSASLSTEELNERPQSTEYRIYDKFCPANGSDDNLVGLAFDRPIGFTVPRSNHGDMVQVDGVPLVMEDHIGWMRPQKAQPTIDIFSHVNDGTPVREPADGFLQSYGTESRAAVDEVAYRLFGFDAMHPFQHELLSRTLTGRNVLGIAATGGGKSECYILPALILPGITIVVSPLKSLMQDQYDQRIRYRYGLHRLATFINGDVPFAERETRLKRMELGYFKLVYFTPEQLERGYVLDSLKRAHDRVGIRFLALDEAHCISQWGHDFRPSYLNLWHRLCARKITPVRIALTATASPAVRRDLVDELQLAEDDLFIHSSNRPELNLAVHVARSSGERTEQICDLLSRLLSDNRSADMPGAAIVFMPWTGGDPDWSAGNVAERDYGHSSPGVTPFAAFLEKRLRRKVTIYHGKMTDGNEPNADEDGDVAYEKSVTARTYGDLSSRNRRGEQSAFIRGLRDIMVATKGFGMGIDKPNIRQIIHRCAPSNLEAYAQEAGRAGRDGQTAEVILFHSAVSATDHTIFGERPVPSDYAIQQVFLSERYIRRMDVLAMRSFLHSRKNPDSARLFFTNDEALDYFDGLAANGSLNSPPIPYEWPEFPPRQAGLKESVEHRTILDRGHAYDSRTRYIDRILAAMHGIRPLGARATKRVVFLEAQNEVEPILGRIELLKASAVLESNHYFGRVFREVDIQPEELQDFLHRACGPDGLEPLSLRLQRSLSETCQIVSDIREADGRLVNGKWKASLLEFRYRGVPRRGSATGCETPAEWLEYAGASKRASKTEASRRAKRAGREFADTDDWFSEKEHSKRKGWEVTLGPSLLSSTGFDEAIDLFVKEQDTREKNDWDAYRLFLTDYIGVGEDGNPVPRESRNCLRAVMLGYLETFEVVVGDDCRSCSRCRPDGNYETDSLWRREKMVVRLGPTLSQHLSFLKEQEGMIPSPEETGKFWDEVTREEQAGRSVRPYVLGWSAKLLTDTPNHQAALWTRLHGMASGALPLQAEEFVEHAERLASVCDDAAAAQITRLLRQVDEPEERGPRLLRLLARLEERIGNYEEAAKTWLSVLDLLTDKQRQPGAVRGQYAYEAHSALARMFAPDGRLPNASRHAREERDAARNAPDGDRAMHHYNAIVDSWGAEDLQGELDHLHDRQLPPRLALSWLEADPSTRAADLVRVISKLEGFASWDPQHTMELLEAIPHDFRNAVPALRIWQIETWASGRVVADDALVAIEALAAMRAGWTPEKGTARHIGDLLFARLPYETSGRLITESAIPASLLHDQLTGAFQPSGIESLSRWLTYLPLPRIAEDSEKGMSLLRLGVELLSKPNQTTFAEAGGNRPGGGPSAEAAARDRLLPALRDLKIEINAMPSCSEEGHSRWLELCKAFLYEARSYLVERVQDEANPRRVLDVLRLLAASRQQAEDLAATLDPESSHKLLGVLRSIDVHGTVEPVELCLLAYLERRAGRPQQEAEAWISLLDLLRLKDDADRRLSLPLEHEAHLALSHLFKDGAALVDANRYHDHILRVALLASNTEEALSHYRSLVPPWSPQRVEEEMQWLEAANEHSLPPKVLEIWLNANPTSRGDFVTELLVGDARSQKWDAAALSDLVKGIPRELISAPPRFHHWRIEAFLNRVLHATRVEVGTAALAAIVDGWIPSRERLLPIYELIFDRLTDAEAFKILSSADAAKDLLYAQAEGVYEPTKSRSVRGWLAWLPSETLRAFPGKALEWLRLGVGVLLEMEARELLSRHLTRPRDDESFTATIDRRFVETLKTLRDISLSGAESSDEAHRLWLKVCGHDARLIGGYLAEVATSGAAAEHVDELLDRLLAASDADLPGVLSSLPAEEVKKNRRLSRLVKLHQLIKRLEERTDIATTTQLEAGHFSTLRWVFCSEGDVEQADMAVELIERLRHGLRPTWLTPVTELIQALTVAQRLEEAEQIAAQTLAGPAHGDLNIRKQPVSEFLAIQSTGPRRSIPVEAADYRQAILSLSRTWKCLGGHPEAAIRRQLKSGHRE